MTEDASRDGAESVFVLDPDRTAGEISPLLFGHNLEHTRRAVWGGASAQLLANRKFAGAGVTDRRAAGGEHGFHGRLRVEGAPDPDGVAAHWYGIGNGWTDFYVDDELPYAGRTSQRLDVSPRPPWPEGVESWGGVGQAGVVLQEGGAYELRVVLRTHYRMRARVRLVDATATVTYVDAEREWSGNEWHTWTVGFTAAAADSDARVEFTFCGPGTAWVGAASLLPRDGFRGLRSDVIAALKDMSVPMLRWPGGNFTRNWRWKEGLLPVDRRPPVLSKNHETLPFTDNYDFQEIGIDDFLALCGELGAAPNLTLNILDDLQNACDLLEYCNGPVDSTWGAVRASRGHPDPYGVRYWSIGNENFGRWMGPAYFPPAEYGAQVRRFAARLRAVDPSIVLIAGVDQQEYTEELVRAAGAEVALLSVHHYQMSPEPDGPEPIDLEIGRHGTADIERLLGLYRSAIDAGSAPGASHPMITLDEWNVWPWWFIRPHEHEFHSGPLRAMYVASALGAMARGASASGLHSAMFFQPVNEGCIAVGPQTAELTATGQVFRLFRAHHGNLLLDNGPVEPDADLDICASRDRDRDRLAITLLNRNPGATRTAVLRVSRSARGDVSARVLAPADLADPDSVLLEHPSRVGRSEDGWEVELPPFGIALVEIPLAAGS